MPKVITIGEALDEIMRPSAGQPLDYTGEFRVPCTSGNPAIFAVAAARLGLSTAIIAGFEAGWPLEQVSRFANTVGALAVTHLGPMEGAPTCHHVENLLSTEKAKRE